MDFEADVQFQVLFAAVVLIRFLVPFWIFSTPLPAIIACLVVDAVDQTVFQAFGYDPPFYQSYDKAMDVFYLGIAYIATLRNWVSIPAFAVSRFLFFYRQVGVVLFELTSVRALLIVFPNTFEYFFIAYEAIRSRWKTILISRRFWVSTAAAIWIVVKLPQEYWIHIAQLDFTDTWNDVSWFAPLVICLGLVVLGILWFVVRPRLKPMDHAWQFSAPPVPPELKTAQQRAAFTAAHDRIWSGASLEKVALIGLLSIIFASILPTVEISPLRLLAWVGVFVIVNAGMTVRRAFHQKFIESMMTSFSLRFLANLALLVGIETLISRSLPLADTIFFVLLFSVLITAYDRCRPVYDYRRLQATEPAR